MAFESCLPEGQIVLDLLGQEAENNNLTNPGINFYLKLYKQPRLQKTDLAEDLSKRDFNIFTQLELIIDWMKDPNNNIRPELTRIFKNYPLVKSSDL